MRRILAIALIGIGLLALVYQGFTYTRETHDAEIGSIELEIHENDRVDIPIWVGVACVVVGSGLLVVRTRRR